MGPDHREPAVGEAKPQEQHLDPEQEPDLGHEERHVEAEASAPAPGRSAAAGSRSRGSRRPGRWRRRSSRSRPRAVVHIGPASIASWPGQRAADQDCGRASGKRQRCAMTIPPGRAASRASRRTGPSGPSRRRSAARRRGRRGRRGPAMAGPARRSEPRARATPRSPAPRCRAAAQRRRRPGSASRGPGPGTSGTPGRRASAAWSARARSPCRPPTARRRAPRTPAGGSGGRPGQHHLEPGLDRAVAERARHAQLELGAHLAERAEGH